MTSSSVTRFENLAELRSTHLAWMEKRLKHGHVDREVHEDLHGFLERVAATGTVLERAVDRSDAQSILGYWATFLETPEADPEGEWIAPCLLPFVPAQAAGQAEPDPRVDNPYQGLSAFEEKDERFFSGRRALLARMISQFNEHGLLAVLGVSGSGKSSLMRAGLLPALRKGALNGSQHWIYAGPFVPGDDPEKNFRQALSHSGAVGDDEIKQALRVFPERPRALDVIFGEGKISQLRRCVIFIDQFEELLTAEPRGPSEAFLNLLIRLLKHPDQSFRLVFTMRSEYEALLLETEFRALVEKGRVRVPSMQDADLLEAIERPAALAGGSVERGLAQRIAEHVMDDAAGLPLLQFAMQRLWANAKPRGKITFALFDELGGSPQKILVNSANAAYWTLSPADQKLTQKLFLELVKPGEQREAVRYRRCVRELKGISPALIDSFVVAGLLRRTRAAGEPDASVEISHESLTKNWPLLNGWIRDNFNRLLRTALQRNAFQLLFRDPVFVTTIAVPVLLVIAVLLFQVYRLNVQNDELERAHQQAAYNYNKAVAALQLSLAGKNEYAGPPRQVDVGPVQVPGRVQVRIIFPCSTAQECDRPLSVAKSVFDAVKKAWPDNANVFNARPIDPSKMYNDHTLVKYFAKEEETLADQCRQAIAPFDSNAQVDDNSALKAPPRYVEIWIGKKFLNAVPKAAAATSPPQEPRSEQTQ